MGLLHSRSRLQWKFKMSVNVCPDGIFWTKEHFVTKPGMVMQHHKPECHAAKLVGCVQCQAHNEGLYNQNMTISVLSSKLLVSLQPNLVLSGITAFKVKVIAKVQNVNECLTGLYFLNHIHRTFCYQIWYGDACSITHKNFCQSVMQKFLLLLLLWLPSRWRSQLELIWSKYDSFYYIFWTVDPLATKLGLMIPLHKPECPVKKVGLVHSGSRSQQRVKMLMFSKMISS